MAAELVDRETGELTGLPSGAHEEGSDFPDVRLDKRFVQTRQGRQFVAYPGLLDLLHQLSEGFFVVDTEVLQLPTAENGMVAVCQARVRILDREDRDVVRRETSGIGDADPKNVSVQMVPHLLRMAETRAKARALRDAVNVGMAALEELGPDEPSERREEPRPSAPAPGAAHIVVEGKTYSRSEVEYAFKKRVEQAKAAGLAVTEVEQLPLGQTPLAVIVGRTQELRRRLEARGAPASMGK